MAKLNAKQLEKQRNYMRMKRATDPKYKKKESTPESREKKRIYMKMKRATDPKYSRVGMNRMAKTPKPGFTFTRRHVIISFD